MDINEFDLNNKLSNIYDEKKNSLLRDKLSSCKQTLETKSKNLFDKVKELGNIK